MGTPIRIQFKEGENPFANKRNTLTPNQMRKRKRLIKHIKKKQIMQKPAAGGFFYLPYSTLRGSATLTYDVINSCYSL